MGTERWDRCPQCKGERSVNPWSSPWRPVGGSGWVWRKSRVFIHPQPETWRRHLNLPRGQAKEGWTYCLANLLPSKPEARSIHSPVFATWFSIPWNRRSALAPYLCQSKYWEMSSLMTSVLHFIACATGMGLFPTTCPPPKENQAAEARLNPGKWDGGRTRGHQGCRGKKQKSDAHL